MGSFIREIAIGVLLVVLVLSLSTQIRGCSEENAKIKEAEKKLEKEKEEKTVAISKAAELKVLITDDAVKDKIAHVALQGKYETALVQIATLKASVAEKDAMEKWIAKREVAVKEEEARIKKAREKLEEDEADFKRRLREAGFGIAPKDLRPGFLIAMVPERFADPVRQRLYEKCMEHVKKELEMARQNQIEEFDNLAKRRRQILEAELKRGYSRIEYYISKAGYETAYTASKVIPIEEKNLRRTKLEILIDKDRAKLEEGQEALIQYVLTTADKMIVMNIDRADLNRFVGGQLRSMLATK